MGRLTPTLGSFLEAVPFSWAGVSTHRSCFCRPRRAGSRHVTVLRAPGGTHGLHGHETGGRREAKQTQTQCVTVLSSSGHQCYSLSAISDLAAGGFPARAPAAAAGPACMRLASPYLLGRVCEAIEAPAGLCWGRLGRNSLDHFCFKEKVWDAGLT